MSDESRAFQAGPDPFGQTWSVQFRWLQTGISIRHADTVDVKFFLKCDDGTDEEKVVALPHPDLLQVCKAQNRKLTDPWCLKVAALHVRRMIENAENIEKTIVILTAAEIAEYDRELQGEVAAVR